MVKLNNPPLYLDTIIKELALLLIIIPITLCFAQDNTKIIEFDFGIISSRNIVKHEFSFKEEIKSVVSLCQCLELEAKKEEKRYIVEVTFNPRGYQGKVSVEGIVLKDQDRMVRIRIHAYVE